MSITRFMLCTVTALGPLSAARGQQAAESRPIRETLELSSSGGRMTFSTSGGRLAIASLRDARGREWAAPFTEKASLWRITLKGPDGASQELASSDTHLTRAEAPFNHLTAAWTCKVGDQSAKVMLDVVFGKAEAARWELIADLPDGWRVTKAVSRGN